MTNETRTPSPHKCPSCKASFTDDGEFGAHMGGQCTPSPADELDALEVVIGYLNSVGAHQMAHTVGLTMDHIEAQSATIARLREELTDIGRVAKASLSLNDKRSATIARLNAEVERMREALPAFERVTRLADTLASNVSITAAARQHIKAAFKAIRSIHDAALAPKEG